MYDSDEDKQDGGTQPQSAYSSSQAQEDTPASSSNGSLPGSVRGAPEHMRAAIRRQQNMVVRSIYHFPDMN